MKTIARAAGALILALGLTTGARAEVGEVRITRQPGMIYMPMILMEQLKLIEKHAAERGLSNLKVSWLTFSSGGASTEALISGNVDFVTSGTTNMLLVWDRTRGEIKGLAGCGGAPMLLVTRNPDVKSLADFTDKDRIAVPTIKISTQAVLLQIAAERQLGEAARNKLDNITVQIGHPDAVAAVTSQNHEINSHFSLPPYQQIELKDPRVHVVLNSYDIAGGPLNNAIVFGRKSFVEANPKTIEAMLAALDEADKLIKDDPKKAAETYLAATKEKLSVDELVGMMGEKGVIFSITPHATMLQAEHLAKSGVLKTKPKDWKDYFFAPVHHLPGT
jgi:NitT/TauT family transport system substrate-binding protein